MYEETEDCWNERCLSPANTLKILPGKKGPHQPQEVMYYILSVKDDWSRFVNLIPIPSQDAGTMYSDRGKEFCNMVFTKLGPLGKYQHNFSCTYNPHFTKTWFHLAKHQPGQG